MHQKEVKDLEVQGGREITGTIKKLELVNLDTNAKILSRNLLLDLS